VIDKAIFIWAKDVAGIKHRIERVSKKVHSSRFLISVLNSSKVTLARILGSTKLAYIGIEPYNKTLEIHKSLAAWP
jgi:hypothetical protein